MSRIAVASAFTWASPWAATIPALGVGDGPPGIALIPSPVERLGGDAQLDDEIIRQILQFDLAALFLPELDQRRLVGAHDDTSVRGAADPTRTAYRELDRDNPKTTHGRAGSNPLALPVLPSLSSSTTYATTTTLPRIFVTQ